MIRPIKIKMNIFHDSCDYLYAHTDSQKIKESGKLVYYEGIHTAIKVCLELKQLIGLGELSGRNVLEIATDRRSPYMELLQKECGANASVVDITGTPKVPGFQLLNENRTPYPDDCFHLVISQGILFPEKLRSFLHWKDPPSVMENIVKDIYRILKPGGFFLSEHEEETRRLKSIGQFEYKGIEINSGMEINGAVTDIWQKPEGGLSKSPAILDNKKIQKRGIF